MNHELCEALHAWLFEEDLVRRSGCSLMDKIVECVLAGINREVILFYFCFFPSFLTTSDRVPDRNNAARVQDLGLCSAQ